MSCQYRLPPKRARTDCIKKSISDIDEESHLIPMADKTEECERHLLAMWVVDPTSNTFPVLTVIFLFGTNGPWVGVIMP